MGSPGPLSLRSDVDRSTLPKTRRRVVRIGITAMARIRRLSLTFRCLTPAFTPELPLGVFQLSSCHPDIDPNNRHRAPRWGVAGITS